jgi:hypothetical protein
VALSSGSIGRRSALPRERFSPMTQTGLQPRPTSSYYDVAPWKNRVGVVSAEARRVDRLRNWQAAIFDAYYSNWPGMRTIKRRLMGGNE